MIYCVRCSRPARGQFGQRNLAGISCKTLVSFNGQPYQNRKLSSLMVYNTQVTLEFNHTCYCPHLVAKDICV